MTRALKRIGLFALTLWVAVTINFLLPRLMPGSPADAALAKIARRGPVDEGTRRSIEALLGVPTGYDRSYVLIDRGSSKALRAPHAGDIAGVNELTGGISNAANGFAELTHGNILHGLGRMLSGVGNTVVGAARTAVQTVKNLFGRLF